MAGDRKLIAVFELQTGASLQNLEELTAAEKQMSESGITAASSLTNAFESIEQRSASLFARLGEGKNVTAAQLTELAAKYVSLGDSVRGAFGSIENAPEAIQRALQVAEQQIVAVNSAAGSMGERVAEAARQFADMATAASSAGEKTRTAVEGAGEALDEIATRAEGATTAMDGMAEAAERAELPLPDIKRGIMSISDAAANMAESVGNAWRVDEEGGRLTARQIGAVVQNHVRLKEAIIEQFGSLEAADAGTREAYEAWDLEIQRLVAHTQELTTAQRAATLGLKEGGEQFAIMGLLAEHLGKQFGESGEKIGSAAGQLGLLAAMSAHLKKSFEGLKLNEFGDGWTRISIQAGATIAVLAAATAAGLKFAETNEQNSETIKDLEKSFHDLIGTDVGSWFGELQAGMQVFLADTFNAAIAVKDFFIAFNTGDFSGAADAIKKAAHAYDDLENETDAARRAQDKRRDSTREAITLDGIMAQIAEQNAETQRRVAVAMDSARVATDRRTSSEHALTAATHEATAADAAAAEKAAQTAENVAKSAEKIAKAKEAEAKAAENVVKKIKDDAEARKAEDDVTKASIAEAEKFAKAKKDEADAAKLAADKLREEAANAKENARQVEEAAKAAAHLKDELRALIDAVNQETGSRLEEQTAIEKQVAKLEEELATNTKLTESEKSRITQMIAVAKEIDALQKKQDALTAAKTRDTAASGPQIAATKAETAATRELYLVTKDSVDATQAQATEERQLYIVKGEAQDQLAKEIKERQDALDSLYKLVEAEKASGTAAIDASKAAQTLSGSWKDGKLTMSNVAESTVKATGDLKDHTAAISNVRTAVESASEATDEASKKVADDAKFWQEFRDKMTELGVTLVPEFSDKITVTAEAFRKLTPEAAAHVVDVDKLVSGYGNLTQNVQGLSPALDAVIERLREVKKSGDAAADAVKRLTNSGESGAGPGPAPSGPASPGPIMSPPP